MGYTNWEGLKVVGGSEIWFACLLNASLFFGGHIPQECGIGTGPRQDGRARGNC